MNFLITPDASPALRDHVASLDQHLQQCRDARTRWFSTAQWAERAHGLVAPRFMTTVAGVALLLALCSWWA